MKIERTHDAGILAKLNYDVQMIHHEIAPNLFKAHNQEDVRSFFEKYLKNDDVEAYVCLEDGIPFGYMMIAVRASHDSPMQHACKMLNLDHICVQKDSKGKGAGKALVNYAKDLAKQRGIKRIIMNYWSDNEQSGQFFSKQGFKTYNIRMAYDVD